VEDSRWAKVNAVAVVDESTGQVMRFAVRGVQVELERKNCKIYAYWWITQGAAIRLS
jgi:hypothetical protein